MGPRHLSRGIVVSAAVTQGVGESASMGPRHLSRGIFVSEYAGYVMEDASMGPRHLSRGILEEALKFADIMRLQWGHGI